MTRRPSSGPQLTGTPSTRGRLDAQVLAVPGGPSWFRQRQQIVDGLGIEPARFATVIHPEARVSPLARIGHNVLLMAGVVITSNAVIGNHVCVLPNTVIHHDVTIGDWTLVGSNVSVAGSVKLGANCYVGSGTRIINGIEIGGGTLVGLGSNVIYHRGQSGSSDIKAVEVIYIFWCGDKRQLPNRLRTVGNVVILGLALFLHTVCLVASQSNDFPGSNDAADNRAFSIGGVGCDE